MSEEEEATCRQIRSVYLAKESFWEKSEEENRSLLEKWAGVLEENLSFILTENRRDLERMRPEDPLYDRLLLTEERLYEMADQVRSIAQSDSPVGRTLEERTLPNGLHLRKCSVPLGVVGVIYEARPNVTSDVFSLCFRSQNGVILKGGKDAHHSNRALVSLIHQLLQSYGWSQDIVQLLPSTRKSSELLLSAVDWVDLIIPRGGVGLIEFVRTHSRVSTIETGAGVVHAYVDRQIDRERAASIICNAKTRRVSVCNALDTLIVHLAQLKNLHHLVHPLSEKCVQLHADSTAYDALRGKYPEKCLLMARKEDFGKEFLSNHLAICTVSSLKEALDHIERYSSGHSEMILSSDQSAIAAFLSRVDAAVVYANASSSFTDGAQFGLGAEIGISTQKMHARGPMGLRELTTYKWQITGEGQIRS